MTILLAIIVSVLILISSPVNGLSIYTIALTWYPNTNKVSLGTIDFSLGRIAVLTLFLRIILNGDLFNIKFNLLDKFVLLYFIGQLISGTQTTPFARLIENRAGDFFDMALPYFAVRAIIVSKDLFITYIKAISISTAILGCIAFFESVTGKNLLAFGRHLVPLGQRMGFTRARISMSHPIYMGVFFGMVGTLSAMLPRLEIKKSFWVFIVFLCFLGAFSSMSSGGLLTMLAGLFILILYTYRHHWKTLLKTIVILILLVEVLSNRHFYHVIDRFTFNSQTAWYRARLIEVAIFENGMAGHWLCGYGFEDPMWGLKIDHRQHTDMVNYYLLVLCKNGLWGFIPFITMIFLSVKATYNKLFLFKEEEVIIKWSIGASLFAVLLAMNSVSLFGQPMTFFYIILATTNLYFGYNQFKYE